MLSRSEAEFALRSEITHEVSIIVGEEFDDHDAVVLSVVLPQVFLTNTMQTVHAALRLLATRCTAEEWQHLMTPELHNWVFAPEVTT